MRSSPALPTVITALTLLVPSAPDAPRAEWTPQVSGVTARLRGVSAVSERVAWASGANGVVLRTVDGGASWQRRPIPGAEQLDFRDVDALSRDAACALSIGPGPASRIYTTRDGGAEWTLQFTNTNPEMFFDAIAFLDADRGFAFSDSVDGHFVVFETTNGGVSWRRIPPARLPDALPGEGAFAASGTNVAVYGRSRVWIGTAASRVLRSADAGATWQIATAPLRVSESAGIFSIAFRDAVHGVVVGGDYRNEPAAIDNVAVTRDGGATWTLVKDRGLSGFRSVVAWVPGGDRSLIALGPSGTDWSADDGQTWEPIAGKGFDTFSFAPGTRTGWASGQDGRIAKLTITPAAGPPRSRD